MPIWSFVVYLLCMSLERARQFINWLGRKVWRPSYSGPEHGVAPRKVRRWKEYEVLDPRDADKHSGHDCVWTRAPGVWTCRTCHEWYRTWEDTPKKDRRQSDRVAASFI